MGDAVIALGTNVALKKASQGDGGYLQFKEEWFQVDNDATPDGSDIKDRTGIHDQAGGLSASRSLERKPVA